MPKNNICQKCDAKCCRYVALEIDKPGDPDSFENIRWYLSHKGVQVFVEEGKWYVQIDTPCRYLDTDNRCSVYAKRPKICRTHRKDNCEATGLDFAYEVHLKSDADLDAWLRSKGKG